MVTQNNLRPDTGDVLLTRGCSLLNKLTCKITGPAGHQATFYNYNSIVEASVQTGRVVQVRWDEALEDLQESGAEWIIFHWVTSPVCRSSIQLDLLEAVEFERYSLMELPLQLIDTVINRWIRRRPLQGYDAYVFRRLGGLWDNGIICSKTGNRALIKNGMIPKSSGLEYGSPSDTYRYLKSCKDVVVLDKSKGWHDFDGT